VNKLVAEPLLRPQIISVWPAAVLALVQGLGFLLHDVEPVRTQPAIVFERDLEERVHCGDSGRFHVDRARRSSGVLQRVLPDSATGRRKQRSLVSFPDSGVRGEISIGVHSPMVLTACLSAGM
jgi:uncharacterized protein (DUF58 family)